MRGENEADLIAQAEVLEKSIGQTEGLIDCQVVVKCHQRKWSLIILMNSGTFDHLGGRRCCCILHLSHGV